MERVDLLFNFEVLQAWKCVAKPAEKMFPGFCNAEELYQKVISAMENKVRGSEDPEHYGGFTQVELDEETVHKMKRMNIEKRGQKVPFIQLMFNEISLEFPPTD